MQKQTRSILDELASMPSVKNPANLVESRAEHIIQSAVNLINFIRENYGNDQALDLERRLINSIKSQDPNKFIRGVRRHETSNENK